MRRRSIIVAGLLFACLTLVPWGPPGSGGQTGSVCLALSSLAEIRIISRVKVTGKNVTLLDLCNRDALPDDWKEAMADVDIGETPALGEDKYVYPDTLRTYLNQYLTSQGVDPAGVRLVIPEKIIVQTQSIRVGQEEVEEIFRNYVYSHAPWNRKDMEVERVSAPSSIPAMPYGELTHEVEASPREQFIGNVTLTVDFYIDGEKQHSVKVSGKVNVHQEVVVARRPLKRDTVIVAEDVDVRRIPLTDPKDRSATEVSQVIGKRLLRAVGMQQPILADFLDKALSVKPGDAVSIVFQQGSLKLVARGRVQDGGGVGDTVRVVNTKSHKVLSCQVLDNQTVRPVQ